MDWHGKVITLVGKDFGHIYNCTIGVVKEKSYFANVISVDMRNILPQFANEKERQGHSMYTKGNLLKNRNRCYNSWGNQDKVIDIALDEPSATHYFAFW